MWYIILVINYIVTIRHPVIALDPYVRMRPVILGADDQKYSKNKVTSPKSQEMYSTIRPLLWSQTRHPATPMPGELRVPRVMPNKVQATYRNAPIQTMPTLASQVPRYDISIVRKRPLVSRNPIPEIDPNKRFLDNAKIKFQNESARTIATRGYQKERTNYLRVSYRLESLEISTISAPVMSLENIKEPKKTNTASEEMTPSTIPPYPGGTVPQTEEDSRTEYLCEEQDVMCHKYGWKTKKPRSIQNHPSFLRHDWSN